MATGAGKQAAKESEKLLMLYVSMNKRNIDRDRKCVCV